MHGFISFTDATSCDKWLCRLSFSRNQLSSNKMDDDSPKDNPLNKMLKQVSRKLEEKDDDNEPAFSDLGME